MLYEVITEPLGPEIEISPGSNCTVVFLNPNDLNPKISTFLTCTNRSFFHIGGIVITSSSIHYTKLYDLICLSPIFGDLQTLDHFPKDIQCGSRFCVSIVAKLPDIC